MYSQQHPKTQQSSYHHRSFHPAQIQRFTQIAVKPSKPKTTAYYLSFADEACPSYVDASQRIVAKSQEDADRYIALLGNELSWSATATHRQSSADKAYTHLDTAELIDSLKTIPLNLMHLSQGPLALLDDDAMPHALERGYVHKKKLETS